MMKAYLALYLATAVYCDDVYVQCNEECTDAGETKISQQLSCCFQYLSEFANVERGISPQKPESLTVDPYVHKKEAKSLIALNITWSIYMTDISRVGYLLDTAMDMSNDWHRILFRVSNVNVNKDHVQSQKVYFNFQRFGLLPGVDLEPGWFYAFTISSLPQPISDLEIDDLGTTRVLTIPDCRCKLPTQSTTNCEEKCLQLARNKPLNEDISFEVTTAAVTLSTTSLLEEPSYLLLALGITGIVVLLAFVVVLSHIIKRWPSRVEVSQQSSIFVVISGLECHTKSHHFELSVVLCRYLEDIGMKVNFTAWNKTKMATGDVNHYVQREVADADHVLLISTLNTRGGGHEVGSSEKQPLLNPTFDPYNIALKLIEVSNNSKGKFSIVYFNQKSKKSFNYLPPADTFQLPQDLSDLLHKIALNGKPQNFDSFMKQLTETAQNARCN